MSLYKGVAVAFVMSVAAVTSASAQLSEPAAYEAMHPDRDVLNGGALTPAARMELERSGRGGLDSANALMRPGETQVGGAAVRHRRYHVRPRQ